MLKIITRELVCLGIRLVLMLNFKAKNVVKISLNMFIIFCLIALLRYLLLEKMPFRQLYRM